MDNNAPGLAIDGIHHAARGVAQAPAVAAPRPFSRPRAVAAAKPHTFWRKLQLPLLLMAGAVGGFFADNLFLGLTLLGGYAVFALVSRVPSRATFLLALILLSAISLMLLVHPNQQLIRNFASYTFVVLLSGVITLAREVRPPKRMKRKYKR